MRNCTWLVRSGFIFVLVLIGALPVFAQEQTFGLSDDDFALLQAANQNSAATDSLTVAFELSGELSADNVPITIDLTGEVAFAGANSGSDGAGLLTVDGELAGDGQTIPTTFELRSVDGNFYISAIDPGTGEPTGWLGDSVDNLNIAVTQALEQAFEAQGMTGLLENQDGLAMSFIGLFGIDLFDFVTVERGDDSDDGMAEFLYNVNIGELLGSEEVATPILALISATGAGTDMEGMTPGLLGAAIEVVLADSALMVRQTIDIEESLVRQTVVTLDLNIDPTTLGTAGDSIIVQIEFVMNFEDYGVDPGIEIPDDAQMGVLESMLSPSIQIDPPATLLPPPSQTAAPTTEPTSAPNTLAPGGNSSETAPLDSVIIDANEPTEIAFDSAPIELIYEASSDQTITVVARSVEGDLDTTIEILDSDGERIAFNDDQDSDRDDLARFDSLIEAQAIEAGTYTIVVNTFSSTGEGVIEITVETEVETAAPTAVPGKDGDAEGTEVIEASVPDSDTYDTEFEGAAGEIVTITVLATDDSLDTVLSLEDSSGNVIAENDDHGTDDPGLGRYDSRIEAFELPDDDTYTIIVRGFAGGGGDFELIIQRGDSESVTTPDTSSIETYTESIDAGDTYTITLDVDEGDMYTITVRALTEDLDPVLAVYDTDAILVISNDDHGGNDPDLADLDSRIERFIFADAGSYTVEVSGYREASGDFEMTVERAATDAPTNAGDDDLFTGEIDLNGTFEQEIDVAAGDYVSVSVRSLSSEFDPYVLLVTETGDVLASNEDHGSADPSLGFYDARINNYPISEDGILTVVISSVNSSGPYALTVNIKR